MSQQTSLSKLNLAVIGLVMLLVLERFAATILFVLAKLAKAMYLIQ